mmetsp:Transcript_15156/g.22321  ORF Transcript_15156/g.22321 Transcript_15156/m.22321 type:complete len:99 (+) Transcript_15156:34-330(+)
MANKDEQNSNLEKVTDYVEEKQLDSEKMNEAISLLGQSSSEDDMAAGENNFTGALSDEDIDLIVNELEVTRDAAIIALRKNGGQPVQAIRSLLQPLPL